MQNPAVLLSWESFQNPFFPDLEIQYLLGNTKSILMYFSTNKGEWDREEKKKGKWKTHKWDSFETNYSPGKYAEYFL